MKEKINAIINSEVFKVLANTAAIIIFILSVAFMSYFYDIARYGTKGTQSVNVFGVKVIYPIAGEPNCHTQQMTAELVSVQSPGFLGGSSTHYYLKFNNSKAFQIYENDVIYYQKDKLYTVTICDDQIYSYTGN